MTEFKALKFSKIIPLIFTPIFIVFILLMDILEGLSSDHFFSSLSITLIFLFIFLLELIESYSKFCTMNATCEYIEDKNEFEIKIGKKKYNFSDFDSITLFKSTIYLFITNAEINIWVDKKTIITIKGTKIKRKEKIEQCNLYNLYSFIKENADGCVEKENEKVGCVLVSKNYEEEYDGINNTPLSWKDYLFASVSFIVSSAMSFVLIRFNIAILVGIVFAIIGIISLAILIRLIVMARSMKEE